LRGNQSPNRSLITKLRNMLRYLVGYLTFLVKRRGDPVHVIGLFSTRSTLVTLLEAWLTRLAAGHFVLTVHNLLPHDRHTALNRIVYRFIYRAPSVLMVHTNRMARELAGRFAIAPSRIVVVEHGFDRVLKYDAQARISWRERNHIPTDARVILLFGQVERYKGTDLLLNAFVSVGADPARHLVIAGMCGDSDLRQELAEAIRVHPHAARIHWLDGFVPHDEVATLLHAADCLAIPYRHIDQSGVLLMALSSGVPIVATDVGSFAEYVSPDLGEIVPPGDARALAAALERVVSRKNATLRDDLIASRFQWRHTVKDLVPTYRQLWGERP
jgi:glycosyltransferase involved in cell wall biosynthesis